MKHVLRHGQSLTVDAGAWDGDGLVFFGTGGPAPTVTFSGANALSAVLDTGATAVLGRGAIALTPGASLVIGRLLVNHAILSVAERPGASVTFTGTSQIVNGSTLTATGYAGTGHYTVDGTMSIGAASTVNMDYVAIGGGGTIALTSSGAVLRVGSVGAGETVRLDNGMLSLTNGMHFLGTITNSTPAGSRIGPAASVAVYNAMDAVREVFDRTTGVLDLFNAQDAKVGSLTFAGRGDLYAAPTQGLATNYMAITSHASAGMLPISFTG